MFSFDGWIRRKKSHELIRIQAGDIAVKRCIFFCASLEQGGAERVISLLSGALAEQGKSIEIVMYFNREIYFQIDSRVKITSVERESKSTNIVRNIFWLRSYFRAHACLICSFLSSFNMLALMASRGLGIPVIVSERTDPMQKNCVYRLARDFLYRFADAIVVQTQKSCKYFSSRNIEPCILIWNPLSPEIKVGSALYTIKEQIVVSVGRLDPLKNQEVLIRAFKKVSHSFPGYKLVIYGEGFLRKHLERVRDELGLHEKVMLLGERHNVFDLISSAQLFVLSSDFEGMPNALLEAMCIGLPVVSTKVSGAVEMIEDGENGLLVNVGDWEGLAYAMEKLLGDEQLRRTLAKRATGLAEKLKVSLIVAEWIRMFDTALGHYFPKRD